jgi:hypothetical protein
MHRPQVAAERNLGKAALSDVGFHVADEKIWTFHLQNGAVWIAPEVWLHQKYMIANEVFVQPCARVYRLQHELVPVLSAS